MEYSDRVYKKLKTITFSHTLSLEEKMDRLKETFIQSIAGVPEDLVQELFEQVFAAQQPDATELPERVEILPDLVDLLYENLDDRRDPFNREQWRSIGELVSDFGVELKESLLTYIMSRVLDHGAL